MAMFRAGTGSPFPVGTNPVSNATADLDGDGHLDLLFVNYISDNVSVLFGDGNGGFTAGAPVPVTNGPRQIKARDLDGDGDIDFLATNYSGNNVSVALNNGNGTFTPGTPVPVGNVPRGLGAADLDGDGDIDFISVNYQSNNLSVMINNGNASFTQKAGSPIATGTRPVQMVITDLDGDGDRDLAVTSNNTNTVGIFINNGHAVFTARAPVATGTGPRGIAAGDVDGDGDQDLVATDFGANTVSVMLNRGRGGFNPATHFATANNPYDVKLGDLDGDRDLDMVVSNSGSSSLTVLLNDGSGVFMPANGSPFPVGVSPGGITLGDFDEDGDLDISSANFGSNTTSILINTASYYSLTRAKSDHEGTRAGTGGDLVFTIRRSATSEAEDVTYTVGGKAHPGSDYTAPSGIVSFAEGQKTAKVHISVTPDRNFEHDENVVLKLTGTSGDGSINPDRDRLGARIKNDDHRQRAGDDNAGSDNFVFKPTSDPGTSRSISNPIADIDHRDDQINLTAIDAGRHLADNQAISWHGADNFDDGASGWLIV
ncbi:FG-GAP-like repeat-containing protein [Rhizobium sp. LjRoot254]|uniref:FG-GAP-like repeat-containing protein n=1 Tax=Rhizobium sp. LjRoot254 TaxID=3342297 RepID=UPI003ECF2E25